MDIKTIKNKWTEILEYMKTEFIIPDAVYKTWLSPMVPYALKGNKLVINFTDKQLGMMGIEEKVSSLFRNFHRNYFK